MKKLMITVVAVAGLLAGCGGVDRNGTRDNIIKSLKAAGVTADGKCVDGVLKAYTDDQLKSIDAQLKKSDVSGQAGELLTSLNSCVTDASTATT